MNSLSAITKLVICSLLFSISLSGCRSKSEQKLFLGVPVTEIEFELNSVLAKWYPRIIDTINGGYWTNFDHDWSMSQNQDKMLVTQARGLWTAAKAAFLFPENEVFKRAADHGYKFLTERMWDWQDGGFFLDYIVNSDRIQDKAYKHIYGNAFALYGLAEYAKINKDTAVLNWVKRTFNWLERFAHDPVYGGYYNIIVSPGLKVTEIEAAQIINRAGWSPAGWKDQNSSIHLLEAITNTCQVWPDELVKERLEEMLKIVRDTMTCDEGYLHLYFTRDLKPVIFKDSSRSFIEKNMRWDHVSFGHDIETAYLLLDASETLYGEPDPVTFKKAKKMVDHTLKSGFDSDYYGLFERGYYFKGADQIEIMDKRKSWWAQAEAWHSLALFATLYPDEPVYQDAFRKMWTYIKNEIVDHQYGEWYSNGLDTSPESKTSLKASAWKGAYHNTRALAEVLKMAQGE